MHGTQYFTQNFLRLVGSLFAEGKISKTHLSRFAENAVLGHFLHSSCKPSMPPFLIK